MFVESDTYWYPKDMTKWHRRFLNLAKEVSSYSKDPSTKVGAVLVNELNEVVSTGYNGFPRGVSDDLKRYLDKEQKLKYIVHAEVNACIQAGNEARGATLYIYPTFAIPSVCSECAKVVIQSGVVRVIGGIPTPEDKERAKRWQDSINLSAQMFKEAGVEVLEIQ